MKKNFQSAADVWQEKGRLFPNAKEKEEQKQMR